MIETIILIAVVSILNTVCFFIGAKVGQKVSNNETIKLPTLNPMEIYKEQESKRELSKEMEEIEKTLENINNYGTEKPQIKI